MERKIKKVVVPETIKEIEKEVGPVLLSWKKIGGGSLHWNNRIIKPGETFEAALEDLPKAFMDTLECLEPNELQKVTEKQTRESQTIEILYKLEEADGSEDLYNVVNEEGKAINEAPLPKESAEELLNAVNM